MKCKCTSVPFGLIALALLGLGLVALFMLGGCDRSSAAPGETVRNAAAGSHACAACGNAKAGCACSPKAEVCDGCSQAKADCACGAGAHAAAANTAFANTHCPMMGSKIDAANVPDSLTREFKGRRVAFCCGGCPGAWDKLTDAEKQTVLETKGAGK